MTEGNCVSPENKENYLMRVGENRESSKGLKQHGPSRTLQAAKCKNERTHPGNPQLQLLDWYIKTKQNKNIKHGEL